MNFSKSKYTAFLQCPKMLWLKTYRAELAQEDAATKARMDKGNEVGDLAMGLFGEFEEMTAYDINGRLNIAQMLKNTRFAVARGVQNICEAAFSYYGLYCAVDILRKEKGGYAIYEVKSSTAPKHVYIVDIAYQKYVLERCGVKVTGTYVVNVDSSYVRGETLEISKLFKVTDVAELVAEENGLHAVETVLAHAKRVIENQEQEPTQDLFEGCREPYPCAFWKYCTRHIPAPSVFDIYNLRFEKQLELYRAGVIDVEAVLARVKLSEIQQRQIDFLLHDRPAYIDKENIKAFLDGLSYPLCFFDFETMQPVVPEFSGSRPYQQIPFQYSLHTVEREGDEPTHKEFLAISGEDPRRALAERLCEDIPKDACVLSFNKSFECTQLRELAALFPDLAEHLLAIRENVQDLLIPFRKGYYYTKEIGNSFSIKSILPAMFPGDPDLDYHNLEGVHNGGEAMAIFPLIKDMPPEKQEAARKSLLKYCELDTYGLVKIWQKLTELCK